MDYGETIYLTIGLTNVGTEDASGVTADISSDDEFVSILDFTADYGTIPAGDTVFVTNGYELTAYENIPVCTCAFRHFSYRGLTGHMEQQFLGQWPCPCPVAMGIHHRRLQWQWQWPARSR
jgi:hypothetical protein